MSAVSEEVYSGIDSNLPNYTPWVFDRLVQLLNSNVVIKRGVEAGHEAFKNLGGNDIILIRTHGAVARFNWPFIYLTEPLNYEGIALGPTFFVRYYQDNELDGSLVYLGSCSSLRHNHLADGFISAGAKVVLGYDDVVSRPPRKPRP